MIEKQNTLEWLDFIITIALESSDSEVSTISELQYENITEKLHDKKQNYISFFNRQRLTQSNRRKFQHLVKEHHGRLLMLMDQAAKAADRINPLNTLTADALRLTILSLYELLSFIHSSLGEYLDLDEPATLAYLKEFNRQHQSRIVKTKQQLISESADPSLVAILLDSLSIGTGQQQAVSFRTIFYHKELLCGLEQTLMADRNNGIDQALVELLIYLNFNSRSFMDYYTGHLTRRIEAIQPPREKIDHLRLKYKQFNQMHRKPGIRLSQVDSDIKKVIANWFTQEIGFLKQHAQSDIMPAEQPAALNPEETSGPMKVMVLLSVDQIGLLLRALDSLRILKARSMNAVFQSIAPYLSTPRTTEISWDSMRSKSYAAEEKDKQSVIKLLESVISWIKEY